MESKAEQYYPTYKAEQRDILLLEFEEAHKIANSQTKMYGQMANILLAVVTVLIPLFFDLENEKSTHILETIQKNSILFSAIIFIFGGLLLRYFVELQKQITINARKVVTLRVLLGLDYGSIHLTLPNWRVEGATNPFAIKYFNGWLMFKSSPFWALTIGVNVIWWFSSKGVIPIHIITSIDINRYWGNAFITIVYLWIFRRNLNERHETNGLNIKKLFLKYVLWIKLVPDFEYVLYRAKLAYLELDRLEINYKHLRTIIVEIEDRNFYKHSGLSYKSLFRSLLSRFKYFRKKYGYMKSGASTITMQLARTLFIRPTSHKAKRKIAEFLLAYWLDRQFTKKEILNLYIASVQFEKKVLGLARAVRYFFGSDLKGRVLSPEESFFLAERLSNITSTVNWSRIKFLAKNISLMLNFEELEKIYKEQIRLGRLKIN